ncbi:MAG: zinc ribbon domain-containing protein [Pseudanabaenaceae cyanobacterium bins.68]|nr:zinc ribbon domain-containing protein [Pseudanabaenaceae cyanobacterium bins.68]
MFKLLKRLFNQVFHRTTTLKQQPLNRISLIILIIVDLFILLNVFSGLATISQWHRSPSQAFFCHNQWQAYQNSPPTRPRDQNILQTTLEQEFYPQIDPGQLGEISPLCQEYQSLQLKVKNPSNQQAFAQINLTRRQISKLESTNQKIRAQYDSTLLEKIAQQDLDQSINQTPAAAAKAELSKNQAEIASLEQQIDQAQTQISQNLDSQAFLQLLQNPNRFQTLDQGYQTASFWYPTIQTSLQALFLLPLIAIATTIYNTAQSRQSPLVALLSWHALVILFIPLIIKIFEILQFGAIASLVFNLISTIFGSLLFLISYFYILLIPVVGFGLIKLFQNRTPFNLKLQASNRIQKGCCVQCNRKIQPFDNYCPHCGYYQQVECPNCHGLTYKHLDYCRHCGHPQDQWMGGIWK